MPTTNQLVRKGRKKKKRIDRTKALKNNPMVKGVVLRTFVAKPRKPNSANRLACRIRLSTGVEVNAYIPGKGHNLQEHSVVMVRGGRTPDLAGFRFRVVRGTLDASGVERASSDDEHRRAQGRSKYGTKRLKGVK